MIDARARTALRRDGLYEGERAPEFELAKVSGGVVSLSEFRGQELLLVFSDPNCAPCQSLLPLLESVADHIRTPRMLVVSRGSIEENVQKASGSKLSTCIQKRWEISRLYASFTTPIAYLIDKEGLVRGNLAVGPRAILELLLAAHFKELLDLLSSMSGPAICDKVL